MKQKQMAAKSFSNADSIKCVKTNANNYLSISENSIIRGQLNMI
jgi:hypothetical protein